MTLYAENNIIVLKHEVEKSPFANEHILRLILFMIEKKKIYWYPSKTLNNLIEIYLNSFHFKYFIQRATKNLNTTSVKDHRSR